MTRDHPFTAQYTSTPKIFARRVQLASRQVAQAKSAVTRAAPTANR
jgi:hypothetical protein